MSTTPLPPSAARNTHLLTHIQLFDEIEVWWPYDREYYPGKVAATLPDGRHRIHYDDGEVEELQLSTEQWRFRGDAAKRVSSSLVSEPHAPTLDLPSSPDDAPLLDRWKGGGGERGVWQREKEREGGGDDDADDEDDDDDDVPVKRVVRRRLAKGRSGVRKTILKKRKPQVSEEEASGVKKESRLMSGATTPKARTQGLTIAKQAAKATAATPVLAKGASELSVARGRLSGRKSMTVAKPTDHEMSDISKTGPRGAESVSSLGKSDSSKAPGVGRQISVKTAATSKPTAPRIIPTKQVPNNSTSVPVRPKPQSLHTTNLETDPPQILKTNTPVPMQAQSHQAQEEKSSSGVSGTEMLALTGKRTSVQNSSAAKTGCAARTMTGVSQSQLASATGAAHSEPNFSKPALIAKKRPAIQGTTLTPLFIAGEPDTRKPLGENQRSASASLSSNTKTGASLSAKPTVKILNSGQALPERRTLEPVALVKRRSVSEGSENQDKSQGVSADTVEVRRSSATDKVSSMRQPTPMQRGNLKKHSKENSADVQQKNIEIVNSNGPPQMQDALKSPDVTGLSEKAKFSETTKLTLADMDLPASSLTAKSGPSQETRPAIAEGEGAQQNADKASFYDGNAALIKSFCRIPSSDKMPARAGGAKGNDSFGRDVSSRNEQLLTKESAERLIKKVSGEYQGSFSRMPKKSLPQNFVRVESETKATGDGADITPRPSALNHTVDATPVCEARIAENRKSEQKGGLATREDIAESKCTSSTNSEPKINSGAMSNDARSPLGSIAEKNKQGRDIEPQIPNKAAARISLLETARSSPKQYTSTAARYCEKVLTGNAEDSQRQSTTSLEENTAKEFRACDENSRSDAPSNSKEDRLTKNDSTKIQSIGNRPTATFKSETISRQSLAQYTKESTSPQRTSELSHRGRIDSRTPGTERQNHILGKRALEEEPLLSKRPKLLEATRDSSTNSHSDKALALISAPQNTTASLELTPTARKIIEPHKGATAADASVPMNVTNSAGHTIKVGKLKGTSQLQPRHVINPQALRKSTDITSNHEMNKEVQEATNYEDSSSDAAIGHDSNIKGSTHNPGGSANGTKEGMVVASASHGRESQSKIDAPMTSILDPPAMALTEPQATDRVAIKSLIGESTSKRSRTTGDITPTPKVRGSTAPAKVSHLHSLNGSSQFANVDSERRRGQENCETLELSAAQTLQITEALTQAAALNVNSIPSPQPNPRSQAPGISTAGPANIDDASRPIAPHGTLIQSSNRPSSPIAKASPARNIPQTAPIKQHVRSASATPNAVVITQQQITPKTAATSVLPVMKTASTGRIQDGLRRSAENRAVQRPGSSRQSSQVVKSSSNRRPMGPASATGTGMPRPSPSSAGKAPTSGRITQDAERGTASLPLDILMRSITESNWRALQKGLGPLSSCIAANQIKTEERLNRISEDLSNCLKLSARLSNSQDVLTKALEQWVSNSLVPAVGTMRTIRTEIIQIAKDSEVALSQEFDAKLKLLTESLVVAVQRNTDAIQGLHCKLDKLVTTAIRRGLESLFTSEGPPNSIGDSYVGAPSQDIVGDTDGARSEPPKQSSTENTKDCEVGTNARVCLSSEKMVEYENVALKARELTGRAIVEWMIYGGARDRAPENERKIAVSLEWVKETSKVGINEALARLETYKKFEEALADLTKTAVTPCIEIAWLVSGPTEDNLRRARGNYSEWDPQLRDFEWESEKRVLFYTATEVLKSEKELLASRNRIRDPLLCSIRCIQVTRIRAIASGRRH